MHQPNEAFRGMIYHALCGNRNGI